MSFEKKFVFLFCVGFFSLAQTNASQIVAAILLNEDGSPRCKIVQEEHDVFSSERFDDFVGTNPQAEDALDELDTLRECDDGDELYAEVVLNPQDIQMTGMPSPRYLTPTLLSIFGLASCADAIYRLGREDENYVHDVIHKAAYGSLWAVMQSRSFNKFGHARRFIAVPSSLLFAYYAVGVGSYSACYLWEKYTK